MVITFVSELPPSLQVRQESRVWRSGRRERAESEKIQYTRETEREQRLAI
jgi:hypothetical protein